jgi:uncharacterized protein
MEVKTQIIEAIQSSDIQKIRSLITENPCLLEEKYEQGLSLIQYASYYRNQAITDTIMDFLSTLDLCEAASTGLISEVKRNLKKKGVEVDGTSADGFTALGLASYFGHDEIAGILIEVGANVNLQSQNQFNVAPLHSAVASNNLKIAKKLLDHGADVNSKQMNDLTPLHSAAYNGNMEIIKLLIERGADLGAKSSEGFTAIDLAKQKENDEVARFLSNL